MLHFLTDAPVFVVRSIMSIANGFMDEVTSSDPAWATAVIHVGDEHAPAVLNALSRYRVEGRRPARQFVSDPTFALAAASIDREQGGSSSAPAQAWAR